VAVRASATWNCGENADAPLCGAGCAASDRTWRRGDCRSTLRVGSPPPLARRCSHVALPVSATCPQDNASPPDWIYLCRRAKIVSVDAPNPTALADELLRTMASIRRSGRLVAARPAELSALTGAQLDLVRLVRRRPGISVGEAAEELRLAANTVSTLVRQLVDAGLLLRTADASDRRIARLALTPDTQRAVGAFRDRRLALIADAVNALPADDRQRLADAVALLGRLAAELPDRAAVAA
jgi:DNA-binding MarR family transcriptional regulator